MPAGRGGGCACLVFAVHLCVHTNLVHTKHPYKAGPPSVARPEMDLPFHDRLAFTGEVPALLEEAEKLTFG